MIDQVFAPPRAVRVRAAPGRVGRIGRILRHRTPRPAQRAGARVERAHFAAAPHVELLSRDRGADHDEVADDAPAARSARIRRRRTACCAARHEIDLATLAESGAYSPSRASSATSRASIVADEDAPRAGRAGFCSPDPASTTRRGSPSRRSALRASTPTSRTQCCLPVTGSSATTLPSGVDRYITPSTTSGVASSAVGLPVSTPASPVLYSHASLSLPTFVAIDLRERRMPVAAGCAAVVRPVAVDGRSNDHGRERQQRETQQLSLHDRPQIFLAQRCSSRAGFPFIVRPSTSSDCSMESPPAARQTSLRGDGAPPRHRANGIGDKPSSAANCS